MTLDPDDVDELRRLRTLDQLSVLEQIGDPVLERIARLAAALTGAPFAGVHVIDDETQHRIASVGAPLDRWPRPDSMCRVVVESGQTVITGDATLDERFGYSTFVHGDSPVRFYASEPLRSPGTAPLGTLCVWDTDPRQESALDFSLADLAGMVVDHLEATRRLRILAEEATTDQLTGLHNRRMLLDVIARALSDHAMGGPPVTAAVIDLDGFKAINDRLGHHAGDAVLAEVGRRLSDGADAGTTPARLGGDEFVIVHLGAVEEALPRIRALAESVERPIAVGDEQVQVGASVGTGTAEPGDDPDTLLRRADHRMYATKVRRRG